MQKIIPLLAIALFSSAGCSNAKTMNGIEYGNEETITGIWFTNFENSRFLECDEKCDDNSLEEWAAIACADQNCRPLDQAARRITKQKANEPPEGAFRIRFIGRRGLTPHKSRFLGDGERDVWIERLLDIQKAQDW